MLSKPYLITRNYGHPLVRGLVFDAPLFEGVGTITNEIANKVQGTIVASGATWDKDLWGVDLDFSAVASRITYTVPAIMQTMNKYSIEVLFYNRSNGGGSLGRIVHKKNNAAGYFDIQTQATSRIAFVLTAATTNGNWTIVNPTLKTWNHLVITYDSVSVAFASAVPSFYMNGEPSTIQGTTQPVGAQVADDTTLFIGNANSTTRNYDGKIAYVRIWLNRILNGNEVRTLYKSPFDLYNKPFNMPMMQL